MRNRLVKSEVTTIEGMNELLLPYGLAQSSRVWFSIICLSISSYEKEMMCNKFEKEDEKPLMRAFALSGERMDMMDVSGRSAIFASPTKMHFVGKCGVVLPIIYENTELYFRFYMKIRSYIPSETTLKCVCGNLELFPHKSVEILNCSLIKVWLS